MTCNVFNNYLKFLKDNSIETLEQLSDILCNEYYMKFIQIDKHICTFISTNFCNSSSFIIQLFDGIIYQKTSKTVNIQRPVYLPEFIQTIEIKDVYKFPLNTQHVHFYSVDSMTMVKVFYACSSWKVMDDKLAHIFNEICLRYKFNYRQLLNKNYIYLFYIKHRDLIPIFKNFKPEIYLFRIFSRDNFSKINVSGIEERSLSMIPALTLHVIPTKYQLYSILESENICSFIIDIHNHTEHRKIYQVSSIVYKQLLKFCPVILKYGCTYQLYLKIKKELPPSKQRYYLNYFNLKKLDNVFHEMIAELNDDYVDKYVNKELPRYSLNHYFLEHKLEILYRIHFVHLQTNKCISDLDIQRIFLYMLDQKIAIEFLQQFHQLYGVGNKLIF